MKELWTIGSGRVFMVHDCLMHHKVFRTIGLLPLSVGSTPYYGDNPKCFSCVFKQPLWHVWGTWIGDTPTLRLMAGKVSFLACKPEVMTGFSCYAFVLYIFMKAVVSQVQVKVTLSGVTFHAPLWADCHSMPILCRMQLVPSFPRGSVL